MTATKGKPIGLIRMPTGNLRHQKFLDRLRALRKEAAKLPPLPRSGTDDQNRPWREDAMDGVRQALAHAQGALERGLLG